MKDKIYKINFKCPKCGHDVLTETAHNMMETVPVGYVYADVNNKLFEPMKRKFSHIDGGETLQFQCGKCGAEFEESPEAMFEWLKQNKMLDQVKKVPAGLPEYELSTQITEVFPEEYGNKSIPVTIVCDQNGIGIRPDGYSDQGTVNGFPIWIEFCKGKVVVRLWSDINEGDPTHSIDMSGAKETNRKKE